MQVFHGVGGGVLLLLHLGSLAIDIRHQDSHVPEHYCRDERPQYHNQGCKHRLDSISRSNLTRDEQVHRIIEASLVFYQRGWDIKVTFGPHEVSGRNPPVCPSLDDDVPEAGDEVDVQKQKEHQLKELETQLDVVLGSHVVYNAT